MSSLTFSVSAVMSTITFRVEEVTPFLRMQYLTVNKYGRQYEQCMNGLGTSDLKLGYLHYSEKIKFIIILFNKNIQ